jgi:hypothetical protein
VLTFCVAPRHRWRDDLDHQPVFKPEFDDVEERLLPLHAAAEGLRAPALPPPDALNSSGSNGTESEVCPERATLDIPASDEQVVFGENKAPPNTWPFHVLRWAQLLPARDPINAGLRSPSQDECVPEQ